MTTTDPYQYFRIEARELVDALVKGVLELEKGAPTAAGASALLRHAHTLKGAARVVKQPAIADHAHSIEEILEPFRTATAAIPKDRLDAVLAIVDAIGERVTGLPAAGGDAPAVVVASDSAGAPVAPIAPVAPVAAAPPNRTVRTAVAEIDTVIDGLGETHTELSALRRDLVALDRARVLIDAIVGHLDTPARRAGELDGERATERARQCADELRRAVAAVQQGAENGLERLGRELRLTRDAVERIRLVPASAVFTELERAVRDVASEQGKQAAFAGSGGDVRLDAHVLETAQLALTQMVRNAVAHGIEPGAARVAAGKPACGQVSLEISRRGRSVVFACRDDGRGVDLDAVREIARTKGGLGADADDLGSDALLRLLLGGGLSTAGTVTEVSGRGIGLDVVRESAQRLGGDAHVSTVAGQGTTVELVVPLSVAAFDVLAVEAAGTGALIPLDAVEQTRLVPADQIHLGPDGDVVTVDGRAVPFVPLAALVHDDTVAIANGSIRAVVVVATADGVAAIGVDRLLGTSSIVVRPLPESVAGSPIVSGTWLDADGNPQLVLAPEGLVAGARRGHRGVRVADERPPDPILVVDDSLTTRMLEQSILESAGYAVEVATSAEEALTVARRASFSLFLVDVEMPGMDGFTFVAQTRADADLCATPAILVSSRNAPEDLQRGFDAGASAYITKGEFDQGVLLERVRELTAVPS